MRLVNVYAATLAIVALGLSFALAACGGDDEPTQTTAPAVTGAADTAAETGSGEDDTAADDSEDRVSERAAIAITLESILTGSDPDKACASLVTDRYLRRSYGDAAGCYAAQQGEKPAGSVRVRQVVVNQDSLAQAQARPRGGLYDGETLRAELVLDQGTWKLDSLRSNVPVGP